MPSHSRRAYLKAAGATTAGILMSGCTGGGSDDGDGTTLTMSTMTPEEHPQTKITRHFMDKASEFNENIEWEYYGSGQLGAADNHLRLVQDGTADVAMVVPTYEAEMNYSTVCDLPGGHTSAEQGARVGMKLAENIFQDEEFDELGVKPLLGGNIPPGQIITKEDEIRTLDDWEGKQVRVSGGAQALVIDAVGGSPVEMASEEMYSALERGTVDGTVLALYGIDGYNLWEVSNHTTTNASLGATGFFWMTDQENFASRPQDVQDALVKAGDETLSFVGEIHDDAEDDYIEQYQDEGMNTYEVSDNNLDSWYENFDVVYDDWASGVPDESTAEDVLDEWQELL